MRNGFAFSSSRETMVLVFALSILFKLNLNNKFYCREEAAPQKDYGENWSEKVEVVVKPKSVVCIYFFFIFFTFYFDDVTIVM